MRRTSMPTISRGFESGGVQPGSSAFGQQTDGGTGVSFLSGIGNAAWDVPSYNVVNLSR